MQFVKCIPNNGGLDIMFKIIFFIRVALKQKTSKLVPIHATAKKLDFESLLECYP
jgi:hypothetical protein